jgi:hypothetical protein
MYKPVTQIPGTVSTDSQYSDLLDALRDKYNAVTDAFPGTPKAPILKDINSVDVSDIPPGAALTKIQMLRDKATSAFNAGDTGLGRDYKALSGNLEDQLDRGIQTMPGVDPDTIANYQDGRTLAAKIHDVRDALRSDGSVDPRKLHANDEGQLTGNLKTAADWAGEFYKTSADPGKLGSVGVNKLGAMLARMTGGGIGAVAGATLGHPIIGAGVGQDLAARAQPLVEEGARWYALGPGQAGAIPDYGQAIPSTRNVATMIQMLKASKPNDPGIAQTLQLENP